jgi:hypothetical protein
MKKKKIETTSGDQYEDGTHLSVARVTRTGGLIVNIEVANQKWIDDHSSDPFFLFAVSPDKEGNPAVIGLHYDQSSGLFEVPKEEKERVNG